MRKSVGAVGSGVTEGGPELLQQALRYRVVLPVGALKAERS